MTSRQRIIDHGEVFTPPSLVNDMLDLVADECIRIEARFLEPACGDGNFLAEVLRRRLEAVSKKRPKKALIAWERDALRGLANLYGIELLYDNVQTCRDRLTDQFAEAYESRFGREARPAVVAAARHIMAANIHFGDALAMTTPGDNVYPAQPLIFTQWSMQARGRFKRKRYEYRELSADTAEPKPELFAADVEPIVSDEGKPVFIVKHVDDLPLVHYLDLADEPHPEELPR